MGTKDQVGYEAQQSAQKESHLVLAAGACFRTCVTGRPNIDDWSGSASFQVETWYLRVVETHFGICFGTSSIQGIHSYSESGALSSRPRDFLNLAKTTAHNSTA